MRIAGNGVFCVWQFSPVFWQENGVPRLPRSHRLNLCHVSYSVFRIAQSLFFWELIFCMFCYSYTEIRINKIVPKGCAKVSHTGLVEVRRSTACILLQVYFCIILFGVVLLMSCVKL